MSLLMSALGSIATGLFNSFFGWLGTRQAAEDALRADRAENVLTAKLIGEQARQEVNAAMREALSEAHPDLSDLN